MGMPPLNISSGPAISEGTSGGTAQSLTGDFSFNGAGPTTWTDTLKDMLPMVALGVVAWIVLRR